MARLMGSWWAGAILAQASSSGPRPSSGAILAQASSSGPNQTLQSHFGSSLIIKPKTLQSHFGSSLIIRPQTLEPFWLRPHHPTINWRVWGALKRLEPKWLWKKK